MKKTALALLTGALFTLTGTQAVAATYEVDSERSQLQFFYKQMGVTMKGDFTGLQGVIEFDESAPEQMSAHIELPLDSVDTGNDEANEELEKSTWFDIAAHPTASFESSQVSPAAEDEYTVDGTLLIKGERQELSIPVTVTRNDEGGLVFETEFEIDRGTFAIGSGSWSDPSIVANEVKIKAVIVGK